GQGRPRPLQARRRHRRGVARDDHDVERGPHDSQRLETRGPLIAHAAGGRQAVTARAQLLRVLFAVLLLLVAGAGLKTRGAVQAAAQGVEQPPQGGFDFPDEEDDAPTWGDDLRAQALDLALVSAFLVLAFGSFFRKSVRLKYVTL